jgi:hypothetical protein
MADWYRKAHDQALLRNGKIDHYPALNLLTALVLAHWRSDEVDLAEVDNVLNQVEQDFVESTGQQLSFWSAILLLDAELVRRLRHGDLDGGDYLTKLVQGYSHAAKRGTSREFSSVVEQLEFLHAMLDEDLEQSRRTKSVRKRLAKALRSMLDKLRPLMGDS